MKKFHPWLRFLVWKDSLTMRNAVFLMRRPHRSFKRTLRRDYKRSLKLPGYWAFTTSVWLKLWQNKRLFGGIVLLYTLTVLLIGGFLNQDTYTQVNDVVSTSFSNIAGGSWTTLAKAGALFFSATVNTANLTIEQQVYTMLIGLLVWLTVVWLLRSIMAGRKPKLRDGLYNSGSPIVATIIVALFGAVQLIPVAIAVLIYSGVASTGYLNEGLGVMLFWVLACLTGSLTLYWIAATLIALVIVTLPGMYPFKALRAAGDIIIGRRLRVFYRFAWLILTVALGWIAIFIPVILMDTGIKNLLPAIKSAPFVPVLVVLTSAITLVWAAAYIYLLYRGIVDDDASPA